MSIVCILGAHASHVHCTINVHVHEQGSSSATSQHTQGVSVMHGYTKSITHPDNYKNSFYGGLIRPSLFSRSWIFLVLFTSMRQSFLASMSLRRPAFLYSATIAVLHRRYTSGRRRFCEQNWCRRETALVCDRLGIGPLTSFSFWVSLSTPGEREISRGAVADGFVSAATCCLLSLRGKEGHLTSSTHDVINKPHANDPSPCCC